MELQLTSPRHLKVAAWILLAALVLLGWFWGGREFALGVLVGGLLAVINFHMLAHILSGTLHRTLGETQRWERGNRQVLYFLKYVLRVTVLAVILYLLIRYDLVNVLGLVVGLSSVVLTLFVMGINEIRKLYFKEAMVSNGTSDSIS